ncbi:MAG: GtrA family protein [Subdoligranulum sp.]
MIKERDPCRNCWHCWEKKDKEEFVALLAQFIKFGLVGVSNTAVSMAVYYIFLWISPDLYMVGSVLGTILSIANAFFLER